MAWRQPVLVWTPIALALGLGWPALMLREEPGLAQAALVGGAIVFAASFVSMGGAWLLGRAPRTRRDVMQHFLYTGVVVALGAPFAVAAILGAVAQAQHSETGLRAAAPYALTPLAVLLGLPIAFFYGMAFSMVALVKQPREGPARGARARAERMHAPQPFA